MTLHFRAFLAALVIVAICMAPILVFAVTLTDEEQNECRDHGGCLIIPMDALKAKFQAIYEKGHEAGRISCGNRT